MISRPVLLVRPTTAAYLTPRFSAQQLSVGPNADVELWDGRSLPIRTPGGYFDFKAHVLDGVPETAKAETLIVWVQGSFCLPQRTKVFPGKRVLVVGDTHHLDRALETAIAYAHAEAFDVILAAQRQHAHWFRAAGLENVYWLAAGAPWRKAGGFIRERRREILIIGNFGSMHPRRLRLIKALGKAGYPVRIQLCSMDEAIEHYARALITLNVSLNGDVNLRLFDVPAAGGCLLMDRLSPQSGIGQYYEEDKHYLAFNDWCELRDKLDRILASPEIAISIAGQAQLRYASVLDPNLVHDQFWALVNERRVHPPYELRLEPRFDAAIPSSPAAIHGDLAIYQEIQECQRVEEAPEVLLLSENPLSIAAKAADLTRVQFYRPTTGLSDATDGLPIRAISHAAARERHWDLVIGPDSGAQAALLFRAARWIITGPEAQYAWLARDADVEQVRQIAPNIVKVHAKVSKDPPAANLANFAREYFDAYSGQVQLLRRARESGPIVFAMHGLLRQAKDFLPALRPLAPYAELVAMDLPEHGFSPAPAMDLPTLGGVVVEYLRPIASSRPIILVGEGVGALVAAAAAKQLGSKAVLLLDPPLFAAKQWWLIDLLRDSTTRARLPKIVQMAKDLLGISSDEVVENSYLEELLNPPPVNCFVMTAGEPLWPRREIGSAIPGSLDDDDLDYLTRTLGSSLSVQRIPGASYPLTTCVPGIIADKLLQLLELT